MKGYRRYGLSYVEITVAKDGRNTPILFEDTTIETPPVEKEGFDLTIQNGRWTYIDKNAGSTRSNIEESRRKKLDAFERWKTEYVNSPCELNGVIYHNDEESRGRVVGAVMSFREFGKLPVAWKAMGGVVVTPLSFEYLLELADLLNTVFQERFYEAGTIEMMILGSQSLDVINGIILPPIPTEESLRKKYLEREQVEGVYEPPKPGRVMPRSKKDPIDPYLDNAVAGSVNGEDVLTINLETVNPGLPAGADTYQDGLKRVLNKVSNPTRVVYELLQNHTFYDDKKIIAIDHIVTDKDGFEYLDVKRYIPGEKIEVSLKEGDSLWIGFIMGKVIKNIPADTSSRSALFEDVTYAGGVYRIQTLPVL